MNKTFSNLNFPARRLSTTRSTNAKIVEYLGVSTSFLDKNKRSW
jgi:hypothetical protein|tara:strand:+ start:356 stop:487 length:132 start_codon:yes stop_codon:yes gene_type:complete